MMPQVSLVAASQVVSGLGNKWLLDMKPASWRTLQLGHWRIPAVSDTFHSDPDGMTSAIALGHYNLRSVYSPHRTTRRRGIYSISSHYTRDDSAPTAIEI
jgi:hypothetical protein